ncbi:MAG: M23 family metallopeptidase [Nocardioidaceae bacterium]
MTYGRTQLSTASRDSDRVSDELRAQTLARRERVEQKRAKRERVEQKRVEQRRAERQRTARLSANRWVLPLANYSLSARFGEVSWLWSSYHTGLDFVAGYGTAIRSVASGTVTEASYDGSYGYKTVVTLENGTELWYCHQTSLAVGVGTAVGPGEVIGYVGTTGNVTGAHLHLEVRPGGGDPVDPFTALTQHGLKP